MENAMNHRHGPAAYGSDCLINTCIAIGAKNAPPLVESIYYYITITTTTTECVYDFVRIYFRLKKQKKRIYLVANINAVRSKI